MSIEFPALRDTLHVTDGNLNRHLKVLESASLIQSSRQVGSGRPKTWLTITAAGKVALEAELAVLRALIASAESS